MNRFTKRFVPGLIAVLLLSSLLLIPAEPVPAKTKFFFGLNVGVPIAPYPMYAYPPPAPVYYPQVYPHPAPARVHHRPVYRAHPPCAQVWTPGYYDFYGNWVFGYYQSVCPPYGY
ncbi:MAG: hypothetical protein K8G79_08225 [bacterium]|uniref:Uncharacterized protein n=1 Tax=Candidatus Methylomirabilis tolerans TaxID=3123416 RepID=A0AAJ1AHY3_9BACT|nr:hypothetical protein [Candidatus Methylomirabilis sp.]